jgi:hypothetical protein
MLHILLIESDDCAVGERIGEKAGGGVEAERIGAGVFGREDARGLGE